VALPYDESGTGGVPVVLLHAGVADRSMWTELLSQLGASGHRAIATDLPGFGEAELGQDPTHLAVVDTLDVLGIERAFFVGNSFGGGVALRVAAVAPERVAGLLLVSTPPIHLDPSPELQAAWDAEEAALERGDIDAAVDAVVEAWVPPAAPEALRERVGRMQRRAFELKLGAEEPDDPDPLEADPTALGRVAGPVLIAAGELDMPDFRAARQPLAQLFRHAEILTIPDAGHLAPIERPEAFRRLLLDYLEELATQPPRR
jgi:pimeloyl-ACP methyl ester carboxylesterase